jgi:hypothetical protein
MKPPLFPPKGEEMEKIYILFLLLRQALDFHGIIVVNMILSFFGF